MKLVSAMLICFGTLALASGCSKTSSPTSTTTTKTDSTPAPYNKLYGATSITIDGDFIVIKSTGLPDHKSPYYIGTQWADSLYEAYNGTNKSFGLAPGRISKQSLVFRIPLHPTSAATKSATSLGPIGVSLNGVPFFNQYNGQGNPLTVEINSFDEWGGHPTPNNAYHYHEEPTYLTMNKGADALLGFLLDGFPVYGPMESGKTITNSDLDSYHGHFGVTADYPNGIYHYHVTSTSPYINGSGYYGTPGTVSQ